MRSIKKWKWIPAIRKAFGVVFMAAMLGLMAYGVFRLYPIFTQDVTGAEWLTIASRFAADTHCACSPRLLIGAAWAVPLGVIIGMNAKSSHRLQPVVQFISSFPAPLFFRYFYLLFQALGISIEYGSIVLMLLGTQWYLFFNVIAGASAIPTDLQEMSESYNIPRRTFAGKNYCCRRYFRLVVTGAITAAGGAWNASIVAEFVAYGHETFAAHGIGAFCNSHF